MCFNPISLHNAFTINFQGTQPVNSYGTYVLFHSQPYVEKLLAWFSTGSKSWTRLMALTVTEATHSLFFNKTLFPCTQLLEKNLNRTMHNYISVPLDTLPASMPTQGLSTLSVGCKMLLEEASGQCRSTLPPWTKLWWHSSRSRSVSWWQSAPLLHSTVRASQQPPPGGHWDSQPTTSPVAVHQIGK